MQASAEEFKAKMEISVTRSTKKDAKVFTQIKVAQTWPVDVLSTGKLSDFTWFYPLEHRNINKDTKEL